MRPRLLDLFSGAGGSAVGYSRAGFDVVGVDQEPMPRYPFEFHQGDALSLVQDRLEGCWHDRWTCLGRFDAIHASPPCQDHSAITPTDHGTGWMLAATRDRLEASGLPWVIENVIGAPMRGPVLMCGAAFGLGAQCRDGIWRPLRRHRLFESNVPLMSPGCACSGRQAIGVYGDGGGGTSTRPSGGGGYKAFADEAGPALGIDWMNRAELSQSIPPAFTTAIGEQLAAHLSVTVSLDQDRRSGL